MRTGLRVLGDFGDEPPAQPLLGRHGLGRVGHQADDVAAHEVRHVDHAAHIRNQPPLGLHHCEFRARRRDADIRAKGQLEPCAKGRALHRRDHRHRQITPDGGDALHQVRCAMSARNDPLGLIATRCVIAKGRDIQPSAEGPPLARQQHGANIRVIHQRFARLDDRLGHFRIDGIHLVAAN